MLSTYVFRLYFTKENLLFKSLNNYSYLEMEGLPQEFFIENFTVNAECLNNRTGEITAGHILCLLLKL